MNYINVYAIVNEFVEEFLCSLFALNEYQNWRRESLKSKRAHHFTAFVHSRDVIFVSFSQKEKWNGALGDTVV